ncbi:MAG: 16S rRNA (guanine(966)-N(2))-methyltransferase RsmD [Alphaproteobacteria bacterium]|nr:16S rRNA (guanine(966)-N(2))-methyltransferase RsmD [Alphaproteobacteria bacterium]
MRLTGGDKKGQTLEAPKGRETRPTTDRVREALFNMLAHNPPALPEGVVVLDLFSGSGALGLECLSRGAAHVTFVEKAAAAARLIRANLHRLGFQDQAQILQADATRLPETEMPAGLILMDPPYAETRLWQEALKSAQDAGWVGTETVIIVESAGPEALDVPEGYGITWERRYGDSRLTRFERA